MTAQFPSSRWEVLCPLLAFALVCTSNVSFAFKQSDQTRPLSLDHMTWALTQSMNQSVRFFREKCQAASWTVCIPRVNKQCAAWGVSYSWLLEYHERMPVSSSYMGQCAELCGFKSRQWFLSHPAWTVQSHYIIIFSTLCFGFKVPLIASSAICSH